jgi:hypothetical protein
VPLLFLLASLGMVLNALWTDPVNTGITFGIILVGVPVYYGWARTAGKADSPAAAESPPAADTASPADRRTPVVK